MDIPYSYRVVALLAAMAVMAGVDRYRKGAQAVRHLEYGYILCCGIVAGALGAANDYFTSNLSPEYFILGKGLESAGAKAVMLGAEAGFSAGVIAGGLCLFAVGARRPSWRRMLQALAVPVGGALAAGAICGLTCAGLDPMNWSATLSDMMTAEQLARFRRVWWIHTGLYAGLTVGLTAMILLLRRWGKAQKLSSAAPDSVILSP